MYETVEPVRAIVDALIVSVFGLCGIWLGLRRIRHPEQARPILGRLAIRLTRLLQGDETAARKEAEITNSVYIRRSGYWVLTVGAILLLSGIAQLVVWALKTI